MILLSFQGSYLDVNDSPYNGTFTITGISGGTITRGADTFKFSLLNEPEGVADITQHILYNKF